MTDAQERVLKAAYAWRYAVVTPNSDIVAAEEELIEAVDQLDIEQADSEDRS